MAHFYGRLTGGGQEVTRCGTETSGMSASINGWNVGIEAFLRRDISTGKDVLSIHLTGGSNGARMPYGFLELREGGNEWIINLASPLKEKV